MYFISALIAEAYEAEVGHVQRTAHSTGINDTGSAHCTRSWSIDL